MRQVAAVAALLVVAALAVVTVPAAGADAGGANATVTPSLTGTTATNVTIDNATDARQRVAAELSILPERVATVLQAVGLHLKSARRV